MLLILNSPYESDGAGGSDQIDFTRYRCRTVAVGDMLFTRFGIIHPIHNPRRWWGLSAVSADHSLFWDFNLGMRRDPGAIRTEQIYEMATRQCGLLVNAFNLTACGKSRQEQNSGTAFMFPQPHVVWCQHNLVAETCGLSLNFDPGDFCHGLLSMPEAGCIRN